MIWVIFSLFAFMFSVLLAVLIAFDEWFAMHSFVEGLLIKLCLGMILPFIIVGVLFYGLFIVIKGR